MLSYRYFLFFIFTSMLVNRVSVFPYLQARSDPQFYATSEDELMDVYKEQCRIIYDAMPKFFKEQPESPMELVKSRNGPGAFYLAGTDDGKRPGR